MAITDAGGALAGVRVLDLTCGVAGRGGRDVAVRPGCRRDQGAPARRRAVAGRARPAHVGPRQARRSLLDPASEADLLALDRLIDGGGRAARRHQRAWRHLPRPARSRRTRRVEPCFWVVMPPYLLDETPWPGDRESAGLLFAWLGHAWNQSSYADVPVDCLFPLALYMQGIWAAIVAVALLTRPPARPGPRPRWRWRAARTAPSWSRPATSPRAATSRTSTGPAGRAAPCPTTGPTAAPTAVAVLRRLQQRVHRPRADRAGAGWIFDDPRVGGEPGNLRLAKNLIWIARELEKVFATRPRAEWLDLLRRRDCPGGAGRRARQRGWTTTR